MDPRVRPVGSAGTAERPSGEVVKRRWRLPGWKLPPPLRWTIWLTLGVAVTALTGYLVAALIFFPAPLLPSEREVPAVTGMSEAEAQREIQRQGLSAAVESPEPHPTAHAGFIIWQDPPAGVAVPRGSAVSVVPSAGEPSVVVPDVHGYDAEIAQRLLTAAGLRVDGVDSVDVKDVPSGMAGSTTPAAGDRQKVGRSITLHLAR